MMTSLLVLIAIGSAMIAIAIAIAFAWRVRPAVVHDHASRRPRVVIVGGGQRDVLGGMVVTLVRGEHRQLMPAAQLDQQCIDRPGLDALSATGVFAHTAAQRMCGARDAAW